MRFLAEFYVFLCRVLCIFLQSFMHFSAEFYAFLQSSTHYSAEFYAFLCRVLDLSFNRLEKVESLERLVRLKKLFLVQNKITKIEGIGHLQKLQMLELGANRIRVSELGFCEVCSKLSGF